MIKTIVFDIGDTLIGFDWDVYIHKLFDDEEVCKVVTEASFHCPLWKEIDRGVIELEDIVNSMIEQAPDYEAEIREAVDRVELCVTKKDYAVPWLAELKERGYQLLFLSNYSDYIISKSQHAFQFMELMDGGIFSCRVGSVKPEKEIYEALFETYGLRPEECVFIDDVPKNIEVGRSFGMKGVVLETYEQAHRELDEILANE